MNRRTFLASAVATSATLNQNASLKAASLESHAKSEGNGLRLGTITYNLGRSWDIETIIRNCTNTKFEGVELRSTHAHGVEIDTPVARRKEVRKRFEDSPITLVQIGSACEFHSPDPSVVRKNIDETKAFVKLASDVGAPGVKVRPNGLPAGVPEEKTFEQIGRSLSECAAFGADHGVQIRMEVHGKETSRLPRMKKMVDYANHPNARLVWNSNPTDLLDLGVEGNFHSVASYISLVHMRDLFVEDYPWRLLLALLTKINYDGFCLAEIPESTDPIRVMKYYRALFRAYQGLA